MKLKELYKNYPNYDIIVWGKNSSDMKLQEYRKTRTPWTGIHTTNKREIDNMEVVEYFIEEKECKSYRFGINLEFKGIETSKGTIYVLVRRESK